MAFFIIPPLIYIVLTRPLLQEVWFQKIIMRIIIGMPEALLFQLIIYTKRNGLGSEWVMWKIKSGLLMGCYIPNSGSGHLLELFDLAYLNWTILLFDNQKIKIRCIYEKGQDD